MTPKTPLPLFTLLQYNHLTRSAVITGFYSVTHYT